MQYSIDSTRRGGEGRESGGGGGGGKGNGGNLKNGDSMKFFDRFFQTLSVT